MTDPRRLLCLACSVTSDVDLDDPALTGCPACGAQGTPADVERDTVSVDITWHELRVITIWAERWASAMPDVDRPGAQRVLAGITDRLHAQHLDKLPLTLTGELSELRSQFDSVTVDGFNEIPPEVKP